MEIGIDSFAAAFDENSRAVSPAARLRHLIEQIDHADEVGLDAFGVGEHHRREFLDSAPTVIFGAAAVRTRRIRLASAAAHSFARAGALGLPLMVAIIGGEPRRFRPLIDLYRETAGRSGHRPEQLNVGVHMLGYVGDSTQEAADTFYPGYAKAMTDIGKERGWPPMTRASFDAQRGPAGALLVGSPDEVVDKILRHSDALGASRGSRSR